MPKGPTVLADSWINGASCSCPACCRGPLESMAISIEQISYTRGCMHCLPFFLIALGMYAISQTGSSSAST